MIGYLDTSAVVPLLITERSSASCLLAWNASDDTVTSQLTYVETSASLAQALRNDRMTADQHRAAMVLFDALWSQIDVLDVDQPLATLAGALAHDYALRGYDAVHCASAVLLHSEDLVAVSGDRKLLQAWRSLGLATFDVNATTSNATTSNATTSNATTSP